MTFDDWQKKMHMQKAGHFNKAEMNHYAKQAFEAGQASAAAQQGEALETWHDRDGRHLCPIMSIGMKRYAVCQYANCVLWSPFNGHCGLRSC